MVCDDVFILGLEAWEKFFLQGARLAPVKGVLEFPGTPFLKRICG